MVWNHDLQGIICIQPIPGPPGRHPPATRANRDAWPEQDETDMAQDATQQSGTTDSTSQQPKQPGTTPMPKQQQAQTPPARPIIDLASI
jgi:hypothetical protein